MSILQSGFPILNFFHILRIKSYKVEIFFKVRLMEKVPGLERQAGVSEIALFWQVVINGEAAKCFFSVDNRSGARKEKI